MQAEYTIKRIIDSLIGIKGIEAIVLGGSRARGNATAKSDIDIGIYYSDGAALDLDKINHVATKLDDMQRMNLITKLGEWGTWINGGGWLTIDNMPVKHNPASHLLWESTDTVSKLKERITPYPVSVQRGIVNKFLWEASFSLIFARKSIARRDVVYAAGCFYRIVSCLIQVLYALNKTYIMNENGALDKVDTLMIIPPDFHNRIDDIFSSVSSDQDRLSSLIEQIAIIVKEVEDLTSKYMVEGHAFDYY